MHPHFLGIGAQRSGTTWLDAQLRTHPDIYLPTRRKEVGFFDKHYDRGFDWYESFFSEARRSDCVGEITPKYLFDPAVPQRMRADLPNVKLIAILRNPAERAFSQYRFQVRQQNLRCSFSERMEQEEELFVRGLYFDQLSRYFDIFPRQNLKVFIFEKVMFAPDRTLNEIATFLGVDGEKFPLIDTAHRVNEAYQPRFGAARAAAIKVSRYLRRNDFDWVVNWANRLGIEALFGRTGKRETIEPAIRKSLLERYEPDIAKLEKLIDQDLQFWRKSGPEPR